jgi:hypothetical protein
MLCHICNREAIGQCKSCLKFYCAEHGNVTCQVCSQAVQGTRPANHVELCPNANGVRPWITSIRRLTPCFA